MGAGCVDRYKYGSTSAHGRHGQKLVTRRGCPRQFRGHAAGGGLVATRMRSRWANTENNAAGAAHESSGCNVLKRTTGHSLWRCCLPLQLPTSRPCDGRHPFVRCWRTAEHRPSRTPAPTVHTLSPATVPAWLTRPLRPICRHVANLHGCHPRPGLRVDNVRVYNTPGVLTIWNAQAVR